MEVSEMNNPSHEKKTSNALKADRVIHRVTFNPNKASPGEILHIPVPKLDDGVVLVPGTLALIFDLTVSGHANNFLVNNVARALVDRFTVKFAGEILQDTNGYDLIKLYEDLFLTEKERAGRISEGIQSEDLSKIRCGSGDKKTSEVAKEIKLNDVYGSRYRIPIDHHILDDHGVFFPRALSDELVFEMRLAPAGSVVKGSDETKLDYELNNIQLEYEVIHSKELADESMKKYLNGKRFMYEHVTHHKTLTIDRQKDSIINESINVPRRSMKGLLLLFYEPYAKGARDSEKSFFPDITEVKVTVNGTPNKVFSQGMKARDMWEEVVRRFGKENSSMTPSEFYSDRFALFIDLRSMKENDLHGSGMRLVNTKDGVQLAINRNLKGSGNIKCHIFILSDAQFNIVNSELESVMY